MGLLPFFFFFLFNFFFFKPLPGSAELMQRSVSWLQCRPVVIGD